jgi:hypothetical protein
MKLNVKESASKSLTSIDKQLTKELKADAIKAGWPRKVVNSLTIKITKLGISVSYPENMDEEVSGLEYGTLTLPPNPVFRKFIDKHKDVVVGNIIDWSLDYLEENGLIP